MWHVHENTTFYSAQTAPLLKIQAPEMLVSAINISEIKKNYMCFSFLVYSEHWPQVLQIMPFFATPRPSNDTSMLLDHACSSTLVHSLYLYSILQKQLSNLPESLVQVYMDAA